MASQVEILMPDWDVTNPWTLGAFLDGGTNSAIGTGKAPLPGPFPSNPNNVSWATDISDGGGVVVGVSTVANNAYYHPFRWTADLGMVDLAGAASTHNFDIQVLVSGDGTIVCGGDQTAVEYWWWMQAAGLTIFPAAPSGGLFVPLAVCNGVIWGYDNGLSYKPACYYLPGAGSVTALPSTSGLPGEGTDFAHHAVFDGPANGASYDTSKFIASADGTSCVIEYAVSSGGANSHMPALYSKTSNAYTALVPLAQQAGIGAAQTDGALARGGTAIFWSAANVDVTYVKQGSGGWQNPTQQANPLLPMTPRGDGNALMGKYAGGNGTLYRWTPSALTTLPLPTDTRGGSHLYYGGLINRLVTPRMMDDGGTFAVGAVIGGSVPAYPTLTNLAGATSTVALPLLGTQQAGCAYAMSTGASLFACGYSNTGGNNDNTGGAGHAVRWSISGTVSVLDLGTLP